MVLPRYKSSFLILQRDVQDDASAAFAAYVELKVWVKLFSKSHSLPDFSEFESLNVEAVVYNRAYPLKQAL